MVNMCSDAFWGERWARTGQRRELSQRGHEKKGDYTWTLRRDSSLTCFLKAPSPEHGDF